MKISSNIDQVWRGFVEAYQIKADEIGLPLIESDPDWPSPCEFKTEQGTSWKPVSQVQQGHENNFGNIRDALGIEIHPDYQAFFTLFFADNLNAQHKDGQLQYLQAWSQDDFERLQQNLIGHLMMKAKLKQAPTLFFALTEEEDLNLVLVNESGEVWLEYVGKEPHKKIATSLAEFITSTQPVVNNP